MLQSLYMFAFPVFICRVTLYSHITSQNNFIGLKNEWLYINTVYTDFAYSTLLNIASYRITPCYMCNKPPSEPSVKVSNLSLHNEKI